MPFTFQIYDAVFYKAVYSCVNPTIHVVCKAVYTNPPNDGVVSSLNHFVNGQVPV